MTTEEKKEVLRSYRTHLIAAQRIKDQIRVLEASVMGRSVNLDGMPRGSGGADLSGWAAKYDELERKLQREYERQMDAGNRIMDGIKGLKDPLQQTVVFEHYISLKRIEKIAMENHYSEVTIWRAHRKAIQAIRL